VTAPRAVIPPRTCELGRDVYSVSLCPDSCVMLFPASLMPFSPCMAVEALAYQFIVVPCCTEQQQHLFDLPLLHPPRLRLS